MKKGQILPAPQNPTLGSLDSAKDLMPMPHWVLVGFGIVVIVFILWSPIGLRTTGLVEEWSNYVAMDRHQNMVTGVMRYVPTRPFTLFVWILGYVLSPGSFLGANVLHVAFFILKGALTYAIVSRLIKSKSISFTTAVLYVTYPSDISSFQLRMLSYQLLIVLFLLSVYLLLKYWDKPRLIILLVMWASLVLSLGIAETAAPMIAFTTLLLPWIQKRISKRVLRVSFLWLIILIIFSGFYFYLNVFSDAGYQEFLLKSASQQDSSKELDELTFYLERAYKYNYYYIWGTCKSYLDMNDSLTQRGMLSGVLGAIIVFLLYKSAEHETNEKLIRTYILFFAVGFIILFLGFLPYLISPPHRPLYDRVFLLAALGPALSFGTLIGLGTCFVPKALKRIALACAAGAIIGLASVGALTLHQQTHNRSLEEQRILATIVEEMPQIDQNTVIILTFDNPQSVLSDELTFGARSTSGHFQDALRFIYFPHNNFFAYICFDKGIAIHSCEFKNDEVVFYRLGTEIARYSDDRIVMFEADSIGNTKLVEKIPDYLMAEPGATTYDPFRRLHPDQDYPKRVSSVFSTWPFTGESVSYERKPENRVRLEFNTPVNGRGWSSPEAQGTWMNSRQSTLDMLLSPGDYHIEFRIINALLPEILDSLSMSVNAQPITLTSAPDSEGKTIFQGIITQQVVELDPVSTRFSFTVNRTISPKELGINEDNRQLALMFDWLLIEPVLKSSSPGS